MAKRYLAKTSKILQRSFCSRFYEKISFFCYNGLRKKYLSASRKITFLFLLMLCTEINFSLDAPISRSLHINVPYATTLNITEYNPKLFSFGENYIHKAHNFFMKTLRYSLLVTQAHSCDGFIPLSVKTTVFVFFASLTQLLIYDDRIIGNCDIKISPIKAQGPPLLRYLFPACFLAFLPQYRYYCATSIFIQKESYLLFLNIIVIFILAGKQFLNLKTKDYKNQLAERGSAFVFLSLSVSWFSKEEVRRHFYNDRNA